MAISKYQGTLNAYTVVRGKRRICEARYEEFKAFTAQIKANVEFLRRYVEITDAFNDIPKYGLDETTMMRFLHGPRNDLYSKLCQMRRKEAALKAELDAHEARLEKRTDARRVQSAVDSQNPAAIARAIGITPLMESVPGEVE